MAFDDELRALRAPDGRGSQALGLVGGGVVASTDGLRALGATDRDADRQRCADRTHLLCHRRARLGEARDEDVRRAHLFARRRGRAARRTRRCNEEEAVCDAVS